MAGNGELFLNQVREVVSRDNLGILVTPTYFESQMSRDAANNVEWSEFRERMKPFGIVRAPRSNVEYLITPKSAPWGMEDVNIFAGEEGRKIYEIDDLETHEGESFLHTNFSIAEGLLAGDQYEGVQISIGFNALDLSFNHHSVLRLHSHVRVAPSNVDIARRKTTTWNSLERFDQLGFVEPFSPLYHDYIKRATEEGILGKFLIDTPKDGVGYTSLLLKSSLRLPKIFGDLKMLYADMKDEYGNIAAIFSDGSIDPRTERLLPCPEAERLSRLEYFLTNRQGFYSPESKKLLHYLARHIQEAAPRDPENPRDVSSTAKIYLTRGFAGAMTFAFSKGSDIVRLDFLPRVMTTNPVIKTIMGEDMPTLIVRTESPATDEDIKVIDSYHRRIDRIVRNNLPSQSDNQKERY